MSEEEKYLLVYDGPTTDDALQTAMDLKGRMDSIPDIVAEATAEWLAENVDPTTAPAIDKSLSVSGAAADAKVVGDKALVQRAAMTNSTDVDTLIDPGVYYKNSSVTVQNGAAPGRARVLVLGTKGATYGVVQLWFDTSAGGVYIRTKDTSASTFSGTWTRLDTTANVDSRAIVNRGSLAGTVEAHLNMDTLRLPGFFYISTSVVDTLDNYPSAYGGRLLCIVPDGGTTNSVQILFTSGLDDGIYVRSTTGASVWRNWVQLVGGTDTQSYTLLPVPRNADNGFIATGMASCPRHRSLGRNIDVTGAYRVTLTLPEGTLGQMVDEHTTDMYVYIYDKDYQFVRSLGPITSDTYSFKVRSGETMFVPLVRYIPEEHINITVSAQGCPAMRLRKNAARTLYDTETDGFIHFGYPVASGLYNTGRLMLPSNYTPDGKPVPVILFVHGSSSYLRPNDNMYAAYVPYWGYLRDQGYAIIDCYGWTSKYPDAAGSSNPWVIPTARLAYQALIDFVTDNYNLDKNNMFVMCKSLGGHMAETLLTTGQFKAGALLAPALVYTGGNQYSSFGYSSTIRSIIAGELGLEGDVDGYINGTYTNEDGKAFWRANLAYIAGAMPNWIGLTGNSAAEKLEEDMSRNYAAQDLCRVGMPPTTIWAARDDTAIDVTAVSAVIRNIQNGGQYAKFRVLPNGTGGHHAVDSDENALKNESDIITETGIFYETGTVPLAYVEAEEFIRKYRTM